MSRRVWVDSQSMFLLLLRSNKTHEGLNRSGAFIKKFIIEFAELCQKKIRWEFYDIMQHFSQLNIYAMWSFLSLKGIFVRFLEEIPRSTMFTFNIITTLSSSYFFLFPRDASNIFRNNDQSFVEKLKKVVARKE